MPERAELKRLILQIERDLAARTHLTALLTSADATIADRRRDVRNLKARMARRSPEPERAK